MAYSTYSSPTPPLKYHSRGPSFNSYQDPSRNRYKSQYQMSRPTSRQDLSKHGDIAHDDGNEVEVTLNGSSTPDQTGKRENTGNYTVKTNDRSDNEFQDNLGTVNTLKGSARPLVNNEELPNQVIQPTRPRLIGFGVGAVNRHLSGGVIPRKAEVDNAPLATAKATPAPRGVNYTRGFVTALASDNTVQEHLQAPNPKNNIEKTDTEPLMGQIQVTICPSNSVGADCSTQTPQLNVDLYAKSRAAGNPLPVPRNPLPDLTRFATAEYIATLIAATPPTVDAEGNPITRPFSFAPLPYTDEDIPAPQPYNIEYPHPITAYASPRVNPKVVYKSGYDRILKNLVQKDLPLTLGTRLYDAGFRDLESSVYLLFSFDGSQGNGIPEQLWSKLENVSSTRLPVGIAGVSPYARANTSKSNTMPPRFAQLNHNQVNMEYGMLTPPGSAGESDYFSKPICRMPDYDPTPRPSPDYQSIRHASSASDMRYPSRYFDQRDSASQYNQVQTQLSPANYAAHQFPMPQAVMDPVTYNFTSVAEPTSGVSPFYKTEICAIWQQSGNCKYGVQCQYAHGADELRPPRHLHNAVRSSAQDTKPTAVNLPQAHGIGTGIAYPAPSRAISLQPHSRATNLGYSRPQAQGQTRTEPRRASCPPQQLATLAEVEDDHTIPSAHRQKSLNILAPIGAERPVHHQNSNPASTRSSISSIEKWEDMPPFTLAGSNPSIGSGVASTQLRSEPSTMSLSLSTSSSSRYSMFSDLSEKPYTYSPIDGDITISNGMEDLGYDYQAPLDGIKNNVNTFNFSNGQSIW